MVILTGSASAPTAGALKIAYKLQQTSQNLLANKRLKACHRVVISGRDNVSIYRRGTSVCVRYGNLASCGCGWVCPLCSARIALRRRVELSFFLGRAVLLGLSVVMVTYTIAHRDDEALADILARLAAGYKRSKSGRGYQALKERYGIFGSARTLEITCTGNKRGRGWHPHYHELLFFRSGDLDALGDEIYDLYEAGVTAAGGVVDRHHGISVDAVHGSTLEYVSKWGHVPLVSGAAVEMSPTLKSGRSKDRRSAWQLLHDCANGSSARDFALWKEYHTATFGLARLYVSPSLRRSLDADQTMTDDVAAFDADMLSDEIVLYLLHPLIWKEILRHHARARVLGWAAEDGMTLTVFRRRISDLVGGMVVVFDMTGDEGGPVYSPGVD